MKERTGNELGRNLAARSVEMTAKSWHPNSRVAIGSEPCRVIDGDPSTWWASPYPAEFPKDIGVEFSKPITVRGVRVAYFPFFGAYVPGVGEQEVQCWRNGRWQAVSGKADNLPGASPVVWQHSFAPVRTRRVRVVISGKTRETLHVQTVEVLSKDLDEEPGTTIWRGGAAEPARHVSSALTDGDPVSCLPIEPLDAVGVELDGKRKINGVVVRYYQFGFVLHEQIPALSEQVLEYWHGGKWKPVQALAATDPSARHALAPYVRCGTVACAFSFAALETSRVRLRFTGPRKRSAVSGFEVYHSSRMQRFVSALFEKSTVSDAGAGVGGREVDLLVDFPFMLEQGVRGGGSIDLARMPRIDPRIASVTSSSGTVTAARKQALDTVIDGRADTCWRPPESAGLPVDIGIRWLNPVMLGRVVVTYKMRGKKRLQPSMDGQDLQVWDGRRWVSLDDEVLVEESGDSRSATWTHTFFCTGTTQLRLVITRLDESCAKGDRISIVGFQAFEDAPKAHKEWMTGPRSDPFGTWVLAQGEPTFERVSSHTPSMIGRACLGLKDEITETGVQWDGSLLTPWVLCDRRLPTNWFLGFAMGAKPRLQAADRSAVKRRLLDGYLPGIEFTHHVEGLAFREAAFATELPGGKGATFVRIRVENPGRERRRTKLVAVMLWNLKKVLPQIIDVECSHSAKHRRVLDANGELVLLYDKGGWFSNGLEKTVAYTLDLAPGETRDIEFRMPRCSFDEEDVERLAAAGFDGALATFRSRFREFYESGMQVTVPEERINSAWHYFLSQIALADYEGKMTYGPYPTRYDNSIWGIEEGPPMVSYAEFGHGETAMQWMSNTYLNAHHLDKSNYHHQYRNGLTPMFVRKLFNVTADKDWLKTAMPLLVDSADWIIEARKRSLDCGELHAGLLPMHYWGGDIHDPCFSLYSNIVCWRGLRDVGLLLQEIGEEERSLHYLKEASEYRMALLDVVQKVKLPYQDPSTVPGKLYWRRPYPYTCTHYQLLMPSLLEAGLLPRGEAEECMRYLEQNGKLFCGIAMLYSGMAIEPRSGGAPDFLLTIDPVYVLGYQLTYLALDEIDRFLLGFYGLLAHGMDRDVLGGPEVGDVCLTEADRDWQCKAERRSIHGWHEPSDPLATESGVGLVMLKKMLVWEETDDEGVENGVVWLCRAAPRAWFEDGEEIRVERAPTRFGEISFHVTSQAARGRIDVSVDLSPLSSLKLVKLRIRHPEKAGMGKVTVDGTRTDKIDTDSETVSIEPKPGRQEISVGY